MANTTFSDGVPAVPATTPNAEWLNQVNDAVFSAIGDGVNPPTTAAQVKQNLGISSGSSYGIVGDGVTDDSAAMTLACQSEKLVDLGGKTCAVSGIWEVPVSGVTIANGVIKALDSANSVVHVTTKNSVKFINVIFDANGLRRYGLDVSTDSFGCVADGVDSTYYTDIFGQGIHVPDHSVVNLLKTVRIDRPAISSTVAGTAGSLATDSYKFMVCGVDALGREGPGYIPSGVQSVAVTGPNGSATINFNKVEGARSYRVYMHKSSTGDWERYFSVPVPTSNPASFSKTITSGDARKMNTPTVSTPAATWVKDLPRTYYLRVAPYFSDGTGNHTGNNGDLASVWFTNNTTGLGASWSAPTGSTPSGYFVFVSHQNSGGVRNFEKCIDVGNVTSYTYTGQVGYKMYPFGNSDEVVCEGYMPRNYGGDGKAIFNGEIHQTSDYGTCLTYQQAFHSDATGTDITNGAQCGHEIRIKKYADQYFRVYWQYGTWGDSDKFWFYSPYYNQKILGLEKNAGVTKPSQSMSCAYASAATGGVTGDGTLFTVQFGTEDYDVLNNYNTGTGVFTVPTDGKYRVSAQVSFNCGATTNAIEITIRAGSRSWKRYTDNVKVSGINPIAVSEVVSATAGEQIYIQARAMGGSAGSVSLWSSAGRETRLSVELVA